MTEALIKEIQELITKLAGELGELSGVTRQNIEDLHVAVNNIASHTLAMEAIVVALAEKSDIDSDAVIAWIRDKTSEYTEEEDEGSVAESLAKSLLGVEEPPETEKA